MRTKRLPTSDQVGPSSLTEEQTEAVAGGRSKPANDKATTLAVGEEDHPPITALAMGEEGSVFTTLAIGEEDACR
jgi:hypothetical protein